MKTSTKCPIGNKKRTPTINFVTNKKNYICGCVAKKGTKYKGDIVWLCLKGKNCASNLEMTKTEALGIISVLTANLFGIESLDKEVNRV